MYTFFQEWETKKTSPILKKIKSYTYPPPPPKKKKKKKKNKKKPTPHKKKKKKKKNLYPGEYELLLAVKLKLSSLWKRSTLNESLDNFYLYEQFSVECYKTKTKPIKTTNHNYQSEQRLTSSLTNEN